MRTLSLSTVNNLTNVFLCDVSSFEPYIHNFLPAGYRMYLWHEVSSEWGSRWAIGDVVGCAGDSHSALNIDMIDEWM